MLNVNKLPLPSKPRTVQEIKDAVAKATSAETSAEPIRAKDLSQGLSGTINQRLEEDRTITLTMRHGLKPEIEFTGFWNGRLVKNAQNAISRAYRLRRHKDIRPQATVAQLQGEAK